ADFAETELFFIIAKKLVGHEGDFPEAFIEAVQHSRIQRYLYLNFDIFDTLVWLFFTRQDQFQNIIPFLDLDSDLPTKGFHETCKLWCELLDKNKEDACVEIMEFIRITLLFHGTANTHRMPRTYFFLKLVDLADAGKLHKYLEPVLDRLPEKWHRET